jgi:hypothetical protein
VVESWTDQATWRPPAARVRRIREVAVQGFGLGVWAAIADSPGRWVVEFARWEWGWMRGDDSVIVLG